MCDMSNCFLLLNVRNGQFHCLEILLRHGAVCTPNKEGTHPLDICIKASTCVRCPITVACSTRTATETLCPYLGELKETNSSTVSLLLLILLAVCTVYKTSVANVRKKFG